MIRAATFAGRNVAVFGLGISGTPTVGALLAGGARVAAWDDSEKAREAAIAAGLPVVDLTAADWSRFDSLVLAPGVPLLHPAPHWTVTKARDAGVRIIGDIEIFARERAVQAPDCPFIAITGTNGKSTTTALIAHILRSSGRDAQMGGNIGTAVLALAPPAPGRHYVIEMSSFQIDLTPTLNPTVGVLLNLSPDHIDRHGTFAAYANVKERLIAGADLAIVGIDDPDCRAIAERRAQTGGGLVRISTKPGGDVIAVRSQIFVTGKRDAVIDYAGVGTLRGAHNDQNAAAAYAVCRALGLADDEIARHMRTYPGLPHRMEDVGSVGEVRFINDSKATNADSTEKALAAFGRDIFWILGGKPKEGGIEMLRPYFPGIVKAYLIGAATEAFAATLGSAVAFERSGTLDNAIKQAAADAAALASAEPSRQPVVLLSPACASYDQFRSFEHRGDVFRDLVAKLPGHRPKEPAA